VLWLHHLEHDLIEIHTAVSGGRRLNKSFSDTKTDLEVAPVRKTQVTDVNGVSMKTL